MTRRLVPVFTAVAAAAVAAGCGQSTLYVSPNGDDAHAGSQAAPLATLDGARDRLRTLDRNQPITIVFAGGTYHFTEPVTFEQRDSGSADAPITYAAAPGQTVRFTGGVEIRDWQPVTDDAVLARLPSDARKYVRVANLTALSITDLDEMRPYGFAAGSSDEPELFFGDEPTTLARWPNAGFRGAASKIDDQHIVMDTDRLARWVDEPAPWIFAYWHHDWAELYEPIVAIDPAKRFIERSAEIKPRYGITPKNVRWYGLNLLSELDAPGEYYIDRAHGLVYFLPPKAEGTPVLSQATGIITGKDVSHVTFRGITFEAARANALQMTGGSDIQVIGCTFRNIGGRAIVMQAGQSHTVYGCDISNCGSGGILLTGGDRATLTPGNHNIENNHLHHFSRRHRTYKPAIAVGGVGNRIAHNLIHHGPHMALSTPGNNHIVEFNEVHNVVYESGDAGAYYDGRDWTQRGTRIRYNYFHDIRGALGHGGMVIYQDDQHSGQIILGNIFQRVSRAVFLGGGDDHIVTNNLFLNCWRSVHLDDRGLNWQRKMSTDPNDTLHTRLRAMPYQSDIWQKQYPTLAGILEDNPGAPKRNVFRANISAGGTWNDIKPALRPDQTVEKNLVYDGDPTAVMLVANEAGHLTGIRFKDADAVRAIGFQPIPVERIGLYQDPRRASWPVRHHVEQLSLETLRIRNAPR